MSVIELNIDRIVGPTHHYGGLAFGNRASMVHKAEVSNPKAAALQGLDKMALLHRLGVKQVYLLPEPRPYLPLLHGLGFLGDEQVALEAAYQKAPALLSAIFSSSNMWMANAATVTPATDTLDGHLHVTVANLAPDLHRAIEANETLEVLKTTLDLTARIHAPLLFGTQFSDEGAANHMRLASSHGEPGVHVFVYGRSIWHHTRMPSHYPARQTLEASESLERNHGIKTRVVYLQQNPDAIDAGIFHNDVIAFSNENMLIMHERAFLDRKALDKISAACDFDLYVVTVTEEELSLADAVSTYFFNSQLVTVPSGGMHLILPIECEQHPAVHKLVQRLLSDDNPIEQVHYVDCRQSMRNGGGPACLRLRVQIEEAALSEWNPSCFITDEKLAQLRAVIEEYYPSKLELSDFLDPSVRNLCEKAMAALKTLI